MSGVSLDSIDYLITDINPNFVSVPVENSQLQELMGDGVRILVHTGSNQIVGFYNDEDIYFEGKDRSKYIPVHPIPGPYQNRIRVEVDLAFDCIKTELGLLVRDVDEFVEWKPFNPEKLSKNFFYL